MAETLLQDMPYIPIPNDKDSGYALVADADVRTTSDDITSSDRYATVSDDELRRADGEAVELVRSLAKRIAKHEDDWSWMSTICAPLKLDVAASVARAQLMCKSQKPSGEEGFRVIMGTAKYKFRDLSAWVAMVARKGFAAATTLT